MNNAKFVKSLAGKLESNGYSVMVVSQAQWVEWIEIGEDKSIDIVETQVITEALHKGEPRPGEELVIFLNSTERSYVINFRPLLN